MADKTLSWGAIVLIMITTGLVVGLVLAIVAEVLGTHRNLSAGVGTAVGIVGGLLISRRLAARKK